MSPRARRDEHKELTRQAVLEVAAQRFAERGFAYTTIDDVARAARVSKGAVYYHFADKAALFSAALVEREEALLRSVADLAARRRDPWDQLDAALAAYISGVGDDPVLCALLEQAQGALGAERRRALDCDLAGAVLTAALERAAQGGELRRGPPGLLARILLSALREAALSAAHASSPAVARRQAGAAVTAMAAGLRRPPGARRQAGPFAGRD